LIEEPVDIDPEVVEIDYGRAGEDGGCGFRGDELSFSEGRQLADRHSVACDNERLAPVESAHDLAALVAQLALRNPSTHAPSVAHVLRDAVVVLAQRL
jgi:hypothetical protein